MSYGVNINTNYDAAKQRLGHDAIEKALALETYAAPADRALIDAASKRFAFTGSSDGNRSARAYRDAMTAAAAAYPADDDVLTLAAESEMDVHAWSYFTPDGKPTPGTEATIARLATVLARDPAHIGANHLLIHIFEESPHPENALAAAKRLSLLSFEPAAEHLAHMPAHTFMRVGDYHAAGDSNARAIALYLTFLAGTPAGHTDYFGHDCRFGVDAFMMSGEYERARTLATTCARGSAGMVATVDLRFRKWDALDRDRELGDFTGGMLLVHNGRLSLAAQRAQATRKSADDSAPIAEDVLDAALARARGRSDSEIAALKDAVRIQDGFGYSEPPAFWYPVRESLGAAYFRAGRYGDAERAFRADLARNAENPRSLFGLSETLAREGRAVDASATRERFDRAWAFADTVLDMQDL
jgi:tetratricopeptide (TPR) repeat protein